MFFLFGVTRFGETNNSKRIGIASVFSGFVFVCFNRCVLFSLDKKKVQQNDITIKFTFSLRKKPSQWFIESPKRKDRINSKRKKWHLFLIMWAHWPAMCFPHQSDKGSVIIHWYHLFIHRPKKKKKKDTFCFGWHIKWRIYYLQAFFQLVLSSFVPLRLRANKRRRKNQTKKYTNDCMNQRNFPHDGITKFYDLWKINLFIISNGPYPSLSGIGVSIN